jgi:hypothetical protein
MAIWQGLKLAFVILLVGALYLFIAASIAAEPYSAYLFCRIWLMALVFAAAARAGFKAKANPVKAGMITGLILLAVTMFAVVWFAPAFLSWQMIGKTVLVIFFFSLIGSFWGLNVAKAKQAKEQNNQE